MSPDVLARKLERLDTHLLADRLADAAGLRNVLVHLYEDIDYEIVAASVDRALEDFGEFSRIFKRRLEEEDR